MDKECVRKDIIPILNILINQELGRSIRKYSYFNSEHEGYAVLREEMDECKDEIVSISNKMNELWYFVKNDAGNKMFMNKVNQIKNTAIRAIDELIQVAAMCEKFNYLHNGQSYEADRSDLSMRLDELRDNE